MPLQRIPLVDPCKCLECDGECSAKVPNKWFQCRPCVKAFHIAPCMGFIEDVLPMLMPECRRCGYWREEHA